jgi:hypothetical protein
VDWKAVFVERYKLRRAWLAGHCHVRYIKHVSKFVLGFGALQKCQDLNNKLANELISWTAHLTFQQNF